MKNKKLRVGMAIASVLFGGVLLFSACYAPPPLEDIVPTAYGEWDGNYVYHGYTKSKTTGEDTEILIETVTLNGAEYRVTGATDTYFLGNEMYSCLSVEPTGEIDGDTEDIPKEEITSCLVSYDLEKKTTKIIYSKWHRLEEVWFLFEIASKTISSKNLKSAEQHKMTQLLTEICFIDRHILTKCIEICFEQLFTQFF